MTSTDLFISKVWEIQSRTIRTTFAGHEQDIYSLDFASNGRQIASGSGDHTVRVWDIEQNREVLSLLIEDGVTTVAISPGETTLRLALSIRVSECGISVLVTSLGDLMVSMVIEIVFTLLHSGQMGRPWLAAVWTRRSRCGSCHLMAEG